MEMGSREHRVRAESLIMVFFFIHVAPENAYVMCINDMTSWELISFLLSLKTQQMVYDLSTVLSVGAQSLSFSVSLSIMSFLHRNLSVHLEVGILMLFITLFYETFT